MPFNRSQNRSEKDKEATVKRYVSAAGIEFIQSYGQLQKKIAEICR